MADSNEIGKIQSVVGNITIVDVGGVSRDAVNGEGIYEGDRVVSSEPDALLEVKYSALPEAKLYTGVFDTDVDSAVADLPETEAGGDIFETEAGEEGIESNSQNIEENPLANEYPQTFGRGDSDAVGFDETPTVDENEFGEGENIPLVVDEDTPPPEDTPPENNPPEALSETVTKVADYIPTENFTIKVAAYESEGEDFELYEHPSDKGWYGIIDNNENKDNQSMIDSHGEYNETISFSIVDGEATTATIDFKNVGDFANANDHISVELYLNGSLITTVDANTMYKSQNHYTLDIDEGVVFDEIRISAEDYGNTPTEFRISSVDADAIGYMPTVLDFVIDDAMLLANDTDLEGDSLEVQLTDGKLMASDGVTQVGTVSVIDGGDNDGDIQVTTFDHADEYEDGETLTFSYVVSDGVDTSDVAIATINVQHDADSSVNSLTGVEYDQTTGEFIIGTDLGNEALSDNTLIVDDTLDLSNVSNINTIELAGDATLIGSSNLGHINPSDVLSATDSDNTLVINSLDGNNAADQVDVDSSFGDASSVVIDGVDYAQYTDGTAILLVEIDEPLDVV